MNTRTRLADRRIDALERELARVQTEESIPMVLEHNLARQELHQTITAAATIARAVIEALAIPIDQHLEEMGRDFVPKK